MSKLRVQGFTISLDGYGAGPRQDRDNGLGVGGEDNPPYHVPVFVLTHHPRKPIEMEGGTTFHFVTEGIEEALRLAKDAAGPKDVRLGGGVETIRQYLRARLVGQIHLAISPVLLGSGEHLLSGIDLPALGYQVEEHTPSEAAMHLVLARSAS